MYLEKQDILNLIDELIERLKKDSVRANIFIVGGSAISYTLAERRVTVDIDSIFEPYFEVRKHIEQIAKDYDIDPKWMNAAVIDMMPSKPDPNAKIYYNKDRIVVSFASDEYLLAMKAISTRQSAQDLDDAQKLFKKLRLQNWMQIEEIVNKYYTANPHGNWGSQELFFEKIAAL